MNREQSVVQIEQFSLGGMDGIYRSWAMRRPERPHHLGPTRVRVTIHRRRDLWFCGYRAGPPRREAPVPLRETTGDGRSGIMATSDAPQDDG